jgi:hypothetical protein
MAGAIPLFYTLIEFSALLLVGLLEKMLHPGETHLAAEHTELIL